MFLKNVSIFRFFASQFPYFAQSVTPGSLCHGNNIAQMPTIRTPAVHTIWYVELNVNFAIFIIPLQCAHLEIYQYPPRSKLNKYPTNTNLFLEIST